MDPLTGLSPVGSIYELAQIALSLSKTLYSLGTAVASASNDIQVLAQDLRILSQSLTILSRLLSKSWYSDDIYLLTARIIKDCTKLYVKIDKIVVNLESNEKSTWKLRLKFVYKEGRIRKLMEQLRDMKGTLATILMSLQVDLQLSLLNISSTSKIQRPPEKPLQPETIETLKKAQKAVEVGGFLPRYSLQPDDTSSPQHVAATRSCSSQYQKIEILEPRNMFASLSTHTTSRDLNSDFQTTSSVSHLTQSFVIIPSDADLISASAAGRNRSSSVIKNVHSDIERESLKPSPSTESSKGAISVQDADLDLAGQVKAVQTVMHAFRTAFLVLHNLIERRIPEKDGEVYFAARDLQDSLHKGSKVIHDKHARKFKEHGDSYLKSLTTRHSTKLQKISSTLMQGVVMKLHEFSAENEDLRKSWFDAPYECSESCSRQVLLYLDDLALSSAPQLFDCQMTSKILTNFDTALTPSAGTRQNFEEWDIGDGVKPETLIPHHPTFERLQQEAILQYPTPGDFLRQTDDERNRRDNKPELSLPFIGYTFKRFSPSISGERMGPSPPNFESAPPIVPATKASSQPISAGHHYVEAQKSPHRGRRGGVKHRKDDKSLPTFVVENLTHTAATNQINPTRNGIEMPSSDQPNVVASGMISGNQIVPVSSINCVLHGSETIPCDYQIQLMLLEQQNKKRMLACQSSNKRAVTTLPIQVPQFSNPKSGNSSEGEQPQCGLKDMRNESFNLCHQSGGEASSAEATAAVPVVTAIDEDAEGGAEAECPRGFNYFSGGPNGMIPKGALEFSRTPAEQAITYHQLGMNQHHELLITQSKSATKLCGYTPEQAWCGYEKSIAKLSRPSKNRKQIFQLQQGQQPQPKAAHFPTPRHDIFQDFDFDLFLHEDEEASKFHLPADDGTFCLPPQRLFASVTSPPPTACLIPPPSMLMNEFIVPNYIAVLEGESPIYVNSKQFHRILKRRIARRALEEKQAPRYWDMSSRLEAMGLPSGPDGRFVTADQVIERNKERDAVKSEIQRRGGAQSRNGAVVGEEITNPPTKTNIHSSLNLNPSTGLPLGSPASHPSPDTQQASSVLPQSSPGPYQYLVLTPTQNGKLWWRSFASTQLFNFQAFEVLRVELARELGLDTAIKSDDDKLCKRLSANIKSLKTNMHTDKLGFQGMKEVLDIRSKVVQIVTTVDEQLGFQVTAVGWSCVLVLLNLHEYILLDDQPTRTKLGIMSKSFSQLRDIVAIIARYAVMDNLYQRSGSVLSLKPEYQSALLSLCSTILEYFAVSFTLGRASMKFDKTNEEMAALIKSSERLMETIKVKDKASQGFRVVVEAKVEGESDSEAEFEDVSDDGWEEISHPSSEDGLIDLDDPVV